MLSIWHQTMLFMMHAVYLLMRLSVVKDTLLRGNYEMKRNIQKKRKMMRVFDYGRLFLSCNVCTS